MNTSKKMTDTVYFDPNPNTPYLLQVDDLLGSVGRVILDNDIEQIANYGEGNSKLYIYSPALKLDDLEAFAKEHIDKYQSINEIFKDEITEYENFDIFPFWEQSQVWAKHPVLSNQTFALLQSIYDAKSLLEQRELSAILMRTTDKRLILRIQQRTKFGDSYLPLNVAPFDLHFQCDSDPHKYKIEGVWNQETKASEFTLNEHSKVFEFTGNESIINGSILFTACKSKELFTELKFYLDGYGLDGIIEEDCSTDPDELDIGI